MRNQRRFHLGRAKPVTGDIDHVVDAASDPVIAVLVTTAAVASEVFAGIGAEISVHEPLVIAVNRAHLARPRVGNAQIAAHGAFQHLALGIDDLRYHAKERQRR